MSTSQMVRAIAAAVTYVCIILLTLVLGFVSCYQSPV